MPTIYLDTEFLVDHVDGAITFRAGTRVPLPADYARALGSGSGGRAIIHGPTDGALAPTLPNDAVNFYDTPFSLANQVHRPGLRMLILWASTGGRNNPSTSIRQASFQRYTDTVNHVGVVECDVSPSLTDWYVGKFAKIISARSPELICFTQVTALGAGTNPGDIHITMTELYTAPRFSISVGQAPYGSGGQGGHGDTTLALHDMQLSADAHSWAQKMNARMDANFEVWNLSAPGSSPIDWQNPDLRAYVASFVAVVGYFSLGVWNFGAGNAYTQPTYTAAEIHAQQADNVAYYNQFVRESMFVGEAGARLYGDSDLLTNAPTLPDFTTLVLNTHYDRPNTTEDFATTIFVDLSHKAMLPTQRGSVTTPDQQNGRMPADYADASGPHWTPAHSSIASETLVEPLIARVHTNWPFSMNVMDNAYDNTATDAGTATNQALLCGWVGAIPTIAAAASGLPITGTMPQGFTLGGSGFDGSTMSASCEVIDGIRSGREFRLHLLDPVVGGATVQATWRGFTGRTLLSMVNDARWRGKLLTLLWDFGVFGFMPHSVFAIDVSLWLVGPVVGTVRVTSPYCNVGNNTMFGAQRDYLHGFNGPHRSLPFLLPNDTFTDAYMQIQVVGHGANNETVTIAGDGTTGVITCSIPWASAFGAIGRSRLSCSVSGSSNALFNVSAADGVSVFTQTAENQVSYPTTGAGVAPGGAALKFNQAFPMDELVIRWADMRLAAPVKF